MKIGQLPKLFAVTILSSALAFSGCSSSEQEEDQLEVSEQEEAAQVAEEVTGEEITDEMSEEEQIEQEAANEEVENEIEEATKDMLDQAAEADAEMPTEAIDPAMEDSEAVAEDTAISDPEPMVEQAEEETSTYNRSYSAPHDSRMYVAGPVYEGESFDYTVERGEWLSRIAEKVYGDASQWKKIADASNLRDPNVIFPHAKLVVPLDSDTAKEFADSYVQEEEQVSITVERGDTLASISESVFGSASHWISIYSQNRDTIKDPNIIMPGMVLSVSKKGDSMSH